MRSVAVISCDHGYGHVRRCMMIAAQLIARGANVTLFAPLEAVERFPYLDGLRVKIVNFRTYTTAKSLRAGEENTRDWHQRLPSLCSFDVVVSDNLPEILEIRPDAILSGGFLWHQVLPDIHKDLAIRAQALLSKHKPFMVSSGLFASQPLMDALDVKLVGLCVSGSRPEQTGKDLLISSGSVDVQDQEFRSAILTFLDHHQSPPFETVWVEKKLMPVDPPIWMKPAVFTSDLYRRLCVCVCRPGVGILTDALWAGVHVVCVPERGNAEMDLNARRVVDAGVGTYSDSPMAAIQAAVSLTTDSTAKSRQKRAMDRLKFDGVRETADILMNQAVYRG